MNIVAATYDYRLFTLSFLISILTSYVGLDLPSRVTAHSANVGIGRLMADRFVRGNGTPYPRSQP